MLKKGQVDKSVLERMSYTNRIPPSIRSGLIGFAFVSIPMTFLIIFRLWRTGFPEKDIAYDLASYVPFVGGTSLLLFCVLAVAGFVSGEVGTRKWMVALAVSAVGAIVSSWLFNTIQPRGLSNIGWRVFVAFAGSVFGHFVVLFAGRSGGTSERGGKH